MNPPSTNASSSPPVDTVEIRLFSVLREKAGSSTISIELDKPVTGAELLELLVQRLPAVHAYRGVVKLAVNLEYADPSAIIRPGDEVAVITPVSGG